MTIDDWVSQTTVLLKTADIPTARLDAELLLAHVLNKPRTFLHAHGDAKILKQVRDDVEKLLTRRLAREPLAYIIGYKEFYGRKFLVTPDVLIPRPETENIVILAKPVIMNGASILDVGTGSGCIGITLKLELPNANVTLLDISAKALNIARKNANTLEAKVNFVQSNLLQNVAKKYDLVVANLPYVDVTWATSPEVEYEPTIALYAKDNGLSCIKKLFKQLPTHLHNGSYLVLEADTKQHDNIVQLAKNYGLKLVKIADFCLLFSRQC
ncbi:peptide chain release factor N(5)-glutamine methyltransferase [Candidatus Saccharibacteria bacterium]|nr:peptide chain release factor N(5)-glutamine methyltransferase [Candidatus Saccharibacteria bacterium]